MTLDRFVGDFLEADAADARRRIREIRFDELLIQADRFEDLRAAIALQRRDAHLRHDLQHALLHGLRVVVDRFAVIDAGQHVLPDHVVQRLKCQIRIDRRCAVADQQTIVMNFARIAAFRRSASHSCAVLHAPDGDASPDVASRLGIGA